MAKSAYGIEKLRQELASKKNYSKLKNLYRVKLPEIKDLNTPSFWDSKFKTEGNLEDQDWMTKDRVEIAASYIPSGKLKLLDIGAGLGWVEEIVSKDINVEIYANDFSGKSVRLLKRRFKGYFTQQSIYKMSYPSNFFDVVLVLEVLEHIPPSKIFKVLRSIHSLLKKEGVIIISVPMNEGL